MDCLDCKITFECHAELNGDIKDLKDIQKDIINGHLMNAIESMDCFIMKMQKRNNTITNRG